MACSRADLKEVHRAGKASEHPSRGGPGSSHEDRHKPVPEQHDRRPDGAPTNRPVSRVSGGGGERDEKHSHVDHMGSSNFNRTARPAPRADLNGSTTSPASS
nr:hypothetical protein [Neorhizobium vignae]